MLCYSSLGLLVCLSRAAFAQHEDLISKLPVCGQQCLSGQLDTARALGCESEHIVCLCETPDFFSAIRGCSQRTCTNSTQQDVTINNIREYCAGLLSQTQTIESLSTGRSGTVTMVRTVTPVSFVFITTSTPTDSTALAFTQIPLSVSGSASTIFPIPSTFASNDSGSSPTPSSSGKTQLQSSSSPLALSDKVGVGVGVPVGVICGFFLSGFLIYRCRKRKQKTQNGYRIASQHQHDRSLSTGSMPPVGPDTLLSPTGSGEGWSNMSSPVELDSQQVFKPYPLTELSADEAERRRLKIMSGELPGDAAVTQELKGDRPEGRPILRPPKSQ